MAFKLTGIENDYSFELRPGATVVVGRAVSSDCAVVDATVSRRHAELVVSADGVQLADVGSSNGTFVNGVKVDSYFVVPGDTITFGKVVFRVEAVTGLTPPPPARIAESKVTATIIRAVSQPVEPDVKNSGSLKALRLGDAEPGEKDRQKLQLLLDVSTGLNRTIDVDALLRKVADYAFDILEGDRCAILLCDAQGVLTPKISRDTRGTDASQAVPQSIARKVVDEKVAVLSENAGEDQRFSSQSIVMQRVRSALCAPLIGTDGRVLGVLYVDRFVSTSRFGESDLDFLIAFAGIASVAIENGQLSERVRREALVRSNFERFFTPQLAAQIADSAVAVKLGGEKRHVAVLFSDIRGFTALSEAMKPEAIATLLTEYFTEMVECVFRHFGTLDKFIGDSVMAQWGAPLSEPADVDRAMEAALDMMSALETLNTRWTSEGRPTLAIGVGLNYGEAFAGYIGSEQRLEYTVIGDTVNTANRLCTAAGAGEILMSEEFRAGLSSPPPVSAMPAIELRGKSQLVSVLRVDRPLARGT